LRPLMNLTVVLLATYVAIGVWGLLLNELSDWVASFNQFAPYALVAALVLIAAAMRLFTRKDTLRKAD
jgi:hypothetical protein